MSHAVGQLIVEHVSKHFGAFVALQGASVSVAPGERRALIGPNGAGKTTLFNVIGGQLRPTSGRVMFDGRDITALPVHSRVRLGVARTFQRTNVFLGLSVLENVRLSVQAWSGIVRNVFRSAGQFRVVQDRARDILERVGLAELASERAEELSYGDQRALELAIALAGEPKMLLIDEPTAGMSPAETAGMVGLLASLPRNIGLLVVEHDMDVVMTLTECVTVFHHGQVLSDGTWEAIRNDARVQQAYLGRTRVGQSHAHR